MAHSVVARKRNTQGRTKVKTGCVTCRIRKIKCDEDKPFCQRCVSTGRTCDGYESPFRIFISNVHAESTNSRAATPLVRSTLDEVAPEDYELLNRYFSTKTMFDVELGCNEEAKQVLRASSTDSTVKHAVSSLRALRETLEASGNAPASVAQQSPNYDYGLQQYCAALGGLASNLACPSSDGLKSALLCCQIFISIEQVRGNFATMAQHFLQGLRIMHEYRARPGLDNGKVLVPANQSQLPFVDIFVVKLFAAPCKFTDLPPTADATGAGISAPLDSQPRQSAEPSNLRSIAPDMRTELVRISASTTELLDKVARVKSTGGALSLLKEKTSLLDSLGLWFDVFERVQSQVESSATELLSVSFMRLFHQVLKIVLLSALNSSSDFWAELQQERDQLQDVASVVSDGVKEFKMLSWTRSGRAERSNVP